MKEIIKTICFICIISLGIGCHTSNDNTYFLGDIRTVEDNISDVRQVTLKNLPLDGTNFGWVAAYDSLMIFLNPKLPNHFYNVFNVDTGKEIGTFCKRGEGPDEVAALGPVLQFFTENDELKTLLFAPNEEKIFIWNITQSLRQGVTVMEREVAYEWRTQNKGACYDLLYLLNKNTLFAKVQSFPLNDEEALSPFFQKRTVDTNKLLKEYPVYKEPVKNGKATVIPEAFFNSHDVMKPDGTKMVQAMVHLPQLNIVDTKTGEVVGYRLEGGPGFSIFEGKEPINTYYIRVQADDNYIYALYWGKEPWGRYEIPYVNILHVFDWNGKLIQKIATDRDIDKMGLDVVRNRLYVTGPKVDEVFYLDLKEIL